jgi:hypothetical protein
MSQTPDIADSIRIFREEFTCGLVQAKAMWDRYGSLERMREAMHAGGFVETERAKIDRLERELVEARRLWRPIETAPRTGVSILLYRKRDASNANDPPERLIGFYANGWVWDEARFLSPIKPTHWMPLPEPPKCD